MARAASRTSSKKRGAASTKTGRGSTRKGSAAKKGVPQKRSASKGRPRRQSKGSAAWVGALQTLIGSSEGRAMLADMFDAVSATLRKQRETATRAVGEGTEAVAGTVETTLDAATEIASGTMGVAQTAGTVLIDVISDAMRAVVSGLPGGVTGETKTRGRRRSPRK
jgi:hypothetical protein